MTTDPRSSEEEANIKKRDDERVFEGDFRYQHAWVVDVNTKQSTRITEGTAYTLQGAPSWSPDGKRFVFGGAATPMLRDNRRDIYVATVDTKQIEKISTNWGSDGQPKWSPDGTTIVWVTEPNTTSPLPDGTASGVVSQNRLVLYDVNAKTIKDIGAQLRHRSRQSDLDQRRQARDVHGRQARLQRSVRVRPDVGRLHAADADAAPSTAASISKDGRTIVVTMDAPDSATEVFVTDPSFANLRRLTNTNPQVADIALGQTEVITWKSSDGVEIEGVLLKPVGFEAGKRYPTLVVAHGGPAGAFVNGFRLGGLEGGQVYAGKGWAVFYPNPRGSSNYGQKTLAANVNDWGGGDFKDIMTGVDALVARGIADPDKLAHIGWSYGGYMTAWVITQTTRFKAAMVGAGLTNMWSMYGTNDIPSVLIAYFGGIPNKQTLPLYLDRSAMSHIDKATTPTLILHGANDERVPVGQAYELYRGLKDRGKTTELVFYPREGHGITGVLPPERSNAADLRLGDEVHFRDWWKQNDRTVALRLANPGPMTGSAAVRARRSIRRRTPHDPRRTGPRGQLGAGSRHASRKNPGPDFAAHQLHGVLGVSARRETRRAEHRLRGGLSGRDRQALHA